MKSVEENMHANEEVIRVLMQIIIQKQVKSHKICDLCIKYNTNLNLVAVQSQHVPRRGTCPAQLAKNNTEII